MYKKRYFLYFLLFTIVFSNACKKEDALGNRDYKTLGSSAHSLLSTDPYSELQIEIHYMPGYAIDTSSINNMVNFLKQHINKPGGINVNQQQIEASGKSALALSEIVSIEKKKRTIYTGNNSIAVHVLVTDGYYSSSPASIGTSYWNTSICIFGKAINDKSGGAGQVTRTALMSTILQHELGHLMGLVNQGSSMQTNHIDAANGAHCTNNKCLMYYSIETGTTANSIPSLDANCIADLKANGGK